MTDVSGSCMPCLASLRRVMSFPDGSRGDSLEHSLERELGVTVGLKANDEARELGRDGAPDPERSGVLRPCTSVPSMEENS